MANGDLLQAIQKAIEDGETALPQKVSNRFVIAGVMEVYKKLDELKQKVDTVQDAVCDVQKTQKEYPSLTWLIVHKPKATIFWIVVILSVLLFALPYMASVFI